MNEAAEVPILSAILTTIFLIGGAGITLIGSLGLLRLRNLLRASPCAHARNDTRHRLRRDCVDDLLLDAGHPTGAA